MNSKRLDIFIYETGLAESRNKAREFILNGMVTVNCIAVTKPSYLITADERVEIAAPPRYVGRAGYKLETAAEVFGINFSGLVCLDAGASTGGFTDYMLKNGAKRVYAVDVGSEQLHESLRNNPKVISMEKQDIRTLEISEKVDFITADLSFISLKCVIPCFKKFLKEQGECVVLIKPQFEAGNRHFKNGVIKDEKIINAVIEDLKQFTEEQGFKTIGITPSKLNEEGKNREFLYYFNCIKRK
ncbi:MAG: TlyA family RNA methyltransferase [Oscillospiraceae bacterium]|nr:TlyA family RNA methyltransferase [Oscillospiraceae bacterium]